MQRDFNSVFSVKDLGKLVSSASKRGEKTSEWAVVNTGDNYTAKKRPLQSQTSKNRTNKSRSLSKGLKSSQVNIVNSTVYLSINHVEPSAPSTDKLKMLEQKMRKIVANTQKAKKVKRHTPSLDQSHQAYTFPIKNKDQKSQKNFEYAHSKSYITLSPRKSLVEIQVELANFFPSSPKALPAYFQCEEAYAHDDNMVLEVRMLFEQLGSFEGLSSRMQTDLLPGVYLPPMKSKGRPT